MTMFMPMLYHWAPADRYEDIVREGLKTYSKPTVTTGRLRWPYICCGFTPSGAWSLSGDFMRDRDKLDPIEEWDLYQITLPEMAEWHMRAEFGPKMQEIKIFTSIPADHIWWVARREEPCAVE